MPQTPHIERDFTASDSVRNVVIGMADGLTGYLAARSDAEHYTSERAREIAETRRARRRGGRARNPFASLSQ